MWDRLEYIYPNILSNADKQIFLHTGVSIHYRELTNSDIWRKKKIKTNEKNTPPPTIYWVLLAFSGLSYKQITL